MVNIITKETFSDFIKSNKVVVVKFFATWCGPCKMITPVLEQVSDELTDIPFGSVDIDQQGELAHQFNIHTVPTIMLFVNEKPVNSFVGFRHKQAIVEFVNSAK
ncbi:thioredoxin domain-containing protein [Candidatus Malacoplasma girerdii]|uniref:Thioredoxin n=1 Tax=Candidatus Malacoplasma girerdii TaxID=1318617 RepID=A0A097STM0_9BACT|nr:thioredoxin domain-containing protein [Candidatus Malacoplasma girerdii]ASJ89461.1 MAG: thioredoxin [Candidatus Malacoplasma girerdii]